MSWGVAVPRTSAEPPTQSQGKSEGLSAQTLVIAAIASAIAAIVVSRLWGQGTIIASAITPVIVALVSEALRKPIESERVRRPVRAVGSTASRASRVSRREEGRPPSGRTPTVMAPPAPGVDEGLRQRESGVEPGPVKVYSSGSNRRPRDPRGGGGPGSRRVKIAVVTGLVAFLIAAVALTLPELIFGGSVAGKRDTTYFGGGKSSSEKGEEQDGSSDGQPDEPADQAPGAGSGGDAPSDSGDETSPDGEQPAPEEPTPAPTPTPAPAPAEPAPTP